MTTYFHYDERFSEFHTQVYHLMRENILETGGPMTQGIIANKLRSARATVRNALIDLDKWGYVVFTRFQPQTTTLTDNDRRLTIDPDKATSFGRIVSNGPTPPPFKARPAEQTRSPTVRMPWEK